MPSFGHRTIIAEKNSSPVRDSSPGGTGWFWLSAEHDYDACIGRNEPAVSAFRYRYSGTGPFLEWIEVTFCFSDGTELSTGPLAPLGERAYGRWEFAGAGGLVCVSWRINTVSPPGE